MTSIAERTRLRATSVPPATYFVGSAVFHYLGPAFAVLLFAVVEPLGVAWLRIATAAAIFALWRKPWRLWPQLDAGERRLILAFGATLGVMNGCFYLAIERLPLGTVAAIEFLPVIALAALGARTARNVLALVVAVAGVYLLTDVLLVAEPLGFAFAFANAALFAALHRPRPPRLEAAHARRHRRPRRSDARRARRRDADRRLGRDPALTDPVVLLAAIGVGIASSVVPYVCDQLAMARMRRSTYALLVSLLPATATVIGIIVLSQIPSRQEIVGVALVVGGVVIHRETGVASD